MYHIVRLAEGSPRSPRPPQSYGQLASGYRPVAIPAVAAVLEVMRPSAARPSPEASARAWAGREFD